MVSKDFTISVTLKYVRQSFTKVLRVLKEIYQMSYKNALTFLQRSSQNIAKQLYKILKSCASNASKVYKLQKEDLFVGEAFANKATILKRTQPRAKGKANVIEKKYSHITISLITKK